MADERDKGLADILRKEGYPYTAEYVEKFGVGNMNPNFWGPMNEKKEEFYKRCVEEGHPWDYYVEEPPEGAIL